MSTVRRSEPGQQQTKRCGKVLCTNLGEIGSLGTTEVDVDQVWLGPEGPQPEMLHPLPPGEESRETRVILGDYTAISAPSLRNIIGEMHSLSSLSRGCNSICN